MGFSLKNRDYYKIFNFPKKCWFWQLFHNSLPKPDLLRNFFIIWAYYFVWVGSGSVEFLTDLNPGLTSDTVLALGKRVGSGGSESPTLHWRFCHVWSQCCISESGRNLRHFAVSLKILPHPAYNIPSKISHLNIIHPLTVHHNISILIDLSPSLYPH